MKIKKHSNNKFSLVFSHLEPLFVTGKLLGERPWRRASGLDLTVRGTWLNPRCGQFGSRQAVCDFTVVRGAHRQKAMANYGLIMPRKS
jgi:hypothetical protein